MPASAYLLSAFIAEHRGQVSLSCLDGWVSGLQAWHMINNAPWYGDVKFVKQVLKESLKLAPPPRPLRQPVTLKHMKALQKGLNMFNPFDAAVWAVATLAFWGCCRLGELTVEFDREIDPSMSVTREFSQVKFGATTQVGALSGRSIMFRIPWTKTTKEQGALLTIVGEDALSPFTAMKNHLALSNGADQQSHLFLYCDGDGVWHPMVKRVFMGRCNEIWKEAGLEELDGHGFRIGGATELLLGGVPPHVVAMVGRWQLLLFLKYWRLVAEIIVNLYSSSYDTSRIEAITAELKRTCVERGSGEGI